MALTKNLNRLTKNLKRAPKVAKRRLLDAYYIREYNNAPIDENLVLIESKDGVELASNMFYFAKALQGDAFSRFRVMVSVKEEKRDQIAQLLQRYGIDRIELVERMTRPYLKVLATAKYLFTDSTFPALFIKKDGQVYTNTWHGTPLKYMGRQVENRVYAMGNVKRNFVMADYLVYPNREMQEKMTDAYSVYRYSSGKILNVGYPRNSVFFDTEQTAKTKEELGFAGKQLIVYMPTWRGTMTSRQSDRQKRDVEAAFDIIDGQLTDDQVFLAKMHPLAKVELSVDRFDHIREFPSGYETYDVLNAADVLVTDYSSVFFDFANSGRKIVLFTYDREEYLRDRGMYYDLEELPFPKVDTPEELVEEIRKPVNYDDAAFRERFCTYDCPAAAEKILSLVMFGEQSNALAVRDILDYGQGRENNLFYVGTLPKNGLTASFVSLANHIGNAEGNIVATFMPVGGMRKYPLRVKRLPEFVDVFPMPAGGFKYSISEWIATHLFYDFNVQNDWILRRMQEHYSREMKRIFGGARFKRVFHQTGYEKRIIMLYRHCGLPNAIFVHNDMVQEIASKGNQHQLTLQHAYSEYDAVVCVTEDIVEPTLELGHDPERIRVVNNFIEHESIHERMLGEIQYSQETKANVRENVLVQLLNREGYLKFINIGRFSPEKGHVRLIDAFERFHEEHPKSMLIIIGGYGPEWENLKKYIKTKKCRYEVILIKAIENPLPILRSCDLFVFSSFYEALGLVVIESQLCGVPVVSTDVTGPRGFMRDHGGYLVEDSEEGILEGMNAFVDGKVGLMDFDPVEYNQNIVESFHELVKYMDGTRMDGTR